MTGVVICLQESYDMIFRLEKIVSENYIKKNATTKLRVPRNTAIQFWYYFETTRFN